MKYNSRCFIHGDETVAFSSHVDEITHQAYDRVRIACLCAVMFKPRLPHDMQSVQKQSQTMLPDSVGVRGERLTLRGHRLTEVRNKDKFFEKASKQHCA